MEPLTKKPACEGLLTGRLGVRALAAIATSICVLSGLCYLIAARVSIQIGVWLYAVALVGPIGNIFLAGMLCVAFFRDKRQNRLAFVVGAGFALAPLAAVCIYASTH